MFNFFFNLENFIRYVYINFMLTNLGDWYYEDFFSIFFHPYLTEINIFVELNLNKISN